MTSFTTKRGEKMRLISTKTLDEGHRLAKTVYDKELNILVDRGTNVSRSVMDQLLEKDIPNIYVHDAVSSRVTIEPMIPDSTKLELVKKMMYISQAIKEQKMPNINFMFGVEDMVECILDFIQQGCDLKYHATELIGEGVYLYDHAIETAILSLLIGKKIGFDGHTLKNIGVGAILCDLGKLYVPEDLLFKKGALLAHELMEIKRHVLYGEQIAKTHFSTSSEVFEIISNHHERLSGLGYPNQKKASDISILVRIVSVSDMFTAMVTDRGYDQRKSIAKTIDILKEMAPEDIDIDVLQVLNQVVDKYPEGTLVKLNNGVVGIVKKVNKNAPTRPILDLVYDGEIVSEMDLMSDLTIYIKEEVLL